MVSETTKKYVLYIRGAQALFLGIFALGMSMALGDVFPSVGIPISPLSITTTMFGVAGSVICEIMARKAEKW